MASIFLTTTCRITSFNPNAFRRFGQIVELSRQDLKNCHNVVSSPSEADLVLFIGDRCIYHSGIYNSELFRKYKEKSLVIDFVDRTIPRIPGFYATIPTYLHKYPIYEYLAYPPNVYGSQGLEILDQRVELFEKCRYLFSFIGDLNTNNIRKEIVHLLHPRSYLQDSSQNSNREKYVTVMTESKFVLCPRGIAASTIRVFETMRAGRVPVIISDEWNEKLIDCDWKSFAIIVPEKNIKLIPEILESVEYQAESMGRIARLVWDNNFSRESYFHRLVESSLKIQKIRKNHENISSRPIYLETLGNYNFSPFWKEVIKSTLKLI